MRMTSWLAATAIIGLSWGTASAKTQGYYQMPAMNDQHLVFASEGDLWRAAPTGGTAVRLTTHPETESRPSISPDGKWIAFSASYDGPAEVYVMPITGGVPKRLTYEGGRVSPRGWMGNGKVLYRSANVPGTIPRLLRTVDVRTLDVEDIPLADANQAAMLADGQTMIFTRYGLSMFSDNAVQYRGGRMAQIWRYRMGSAQEAVRLAADFGAPMRHPMVWNGRIYFISDKSGTDNIWSMDTGGGDVQQVTQSSAWQIRTPMLHGGKIVYQSGADLFAYDIAARATASIALDLTTDRDMQRRRWLKNPLNYRSNAAIAPSGESVTITARGHFITGFKGKQRRVDYKLPEGARARSAVMGADGSSVYALIDRELSGEIWQFNADGTGEGRAVRTGLRDYVWFITASPADDVLLLSDKRGRLHHFDVGTGAVTTMHTTQSGSDYAFGDISWSKNGRYVTYGFYDARDIAQIAIYDTKTHTKTVMTSGKYESFAPALSSDNAWLYFLSNRNFEASPGSPWGDRKMGTAFNERAKLYALQLDAEAAFPFEPEDELSGDDAKDEEEGEDEDKDSEDENSDEAPALNLYGAASRLWEVPVRSGDFVGMAAAEDHLYLLEGGGGDLVYTSADGDNLTRVEITSEKPKVEDFAEKIRRFELSADRETLFVQKGRRSGAQFMLLSASKSFPKDTSDKKIRVSDWKLAIDPASEWKQMALDAWRLHRDFAYDSELRGVDWDAVREKFVPLADRLGHRAELNDLLAQMSAELGILHSQIRSGELPRDHEKGSPAFLGATYKPAREGLHIATIYTGEADRPHTLGPLLKSGVDVREGDIITAVDGRRVETQADMALALTQKAGQQVRLDLLRGGESHSEIVVAASGRTASRLRYNHWVQKNREAVAKASNGTVGYLHLRAMGSRDVASFARNYFEHVDKGGIIIDVRGNNGGNIDSMILSTLLRRVWAYWPGANGGPSSPNMQQTFRGHLAVLINEGTYSDGETFAAGIKALDLAPTIGTRTAGAGIWLSDRNRLADGGQARVAEFGQMGIDGRWLIEGLGVSPDIEVANPPRSTYRGEDRQLDRAVSYLQNKIRTEPIPPFPRRPAYPKLGETGRDVD